MPPITFGYQQAQSSDSSSVVINISQEELNETLESLKIVPPPHKVKSGFDINIFHAVANFIDKKTGVKFEKYVTNQATWSSSNQSQLATSLSPGIFDASRAIIGQSYTIQATYGDKTTNFEVKIPNEFLKEFYIHAFSGENANFEQGQRAVFEPRFILSDAETKYDREQQVFAQFFLNGVRLNSGNEQKQLIIDTTECISQKIHHDIATGLT
jgi:hypothetical protein